MDLRHNVREKRTYTLRASVPNLGRKHGEPGSSFSECCDFSSLRQQIPPRALPSLPVRSGKTAPPLSSPDYAFFPFSDRGIASQTKCKKWKQWLRKKKNFYAYQAEDPSSLVAGTAVHQKSDPPKSLNKHPTTTIQDGYMVRYETKNTLVR